MKAVNKTSVWIRSVTTCMLLLLSRTEVSAQTQQPTGRFVDQTFRDDTGEHKYVVFVPSRYQADKPSPAILFLTQLPQLGFQLPGSGFPAIPAGSHPVDKVDGLLQAGFGLDALLFPLVAALSEESHQHLGTTFVLHITPIHIYELRHPCRSLQNR